MPLCPVACCGVQDAGGSLTTIAEDIGTILKRSRGHGVGRYFGYNRLLKDLYSLGSADLKEAEVSSVTVWNNRPLAG